ncbi:proline reductase cluster protein PrdD [Clostridium sp. CTA-19]
MYKFKNLRKLVIRAFHIEEVKFYDKTFIDNKTLYIRKNIMEDIEFDREIIKSIDLNIIYKNERNILVNSIMDFYPIATKVLGELGEGITHVITGVTVMINGVDDNGIQIGEFGSSEGILNEQVVFGKAGTPDIDDIIIQFDVVVNKGRASERETILEIHKCCDKVIQNIRELLKNINGRYCDEKHEYYDKVNKEGKKVVIIKQVAGQGAMYDTALLGNEPCSSIGAKSIIDMGNIPIILTPNEYRDGALRAMH